MNEFQKQLLDRIDVLATKVGTTAQHLWAVLIIQSRIEAITYVVWIFITVMLVGVIYEGWKKALTHKGYWDHEEAAYLGLILVSIFGVLGIGFSICALLELPGLLFNPEFWALTQLLQK